jgi:hypothetical protein
MDDQIRQRTRYLATQSWMQLIEAIEQARTEDGGSKVTAISHHALNMGGGMQWTAVVVLERSVPRLPE